MKYLAPVIFILFVSLASCRQPDKSHKFVGRWHAAANRTDLLIISRFGHGFVLEDSLVFGPFKPKASYNESLDQMEFLTDSAKIEIRYDKNTDHILGNFGNGEYIKVR